MRINRNTPVIIVLALWMFMVGLVVTFWGVVIWVAWHFISKWW